MNERNDHGPHPDPEPDGGPAGASLFETTGAGTLLLLAVACLLLYFFFQGTLWSGEPGSSLWGLAVSPLLGILLPVWLFLKQMGRSFREELWLFALTPRQVLGVVLAMGGTVPLAYAASALNEWIVPADPTYQEGLRALVPHDAMSFVAGSLGIVVLAPLGEEVLFRGLLLGTLGRSMRAVTAIVVTGFFFAVTHLAPWLLLPITLLGIVLGIMVWLTRTLTASWMGHALFNLAGYLEMARTGNVETPGLSRLSLHPLMLVVVPACMAGAFLLLRSSEAAQEVPAPDPGERGKVEE